MSFNLKLKVVTCYQLPHLFLNNWKVYNEFTVELQMTQVITVFSELC